jgi:hypothetical protein
VRTARGSLYETKHWLRRAYNRNLLTNDHISKLKATLDKLAPMLNSYLRSIGKVAEHWFCGAVRRSQPMLATDY